MGKMDLVGVLVDLGDFSWSPHRPRDGGETSPEEQKYLSVVLDGSHFCPTLEGPARAPELINYPRNGTLMARGVLACC
jgi:hypothetical protein